MIEWLRPGWLLLVPAGLLAAWLWWRARTGLGPWRRAVDPELLAALAAEAPARAGRPALALGAVVLALVCAALAGPSWHTQPVALKRDAGARVVVLDLSPSMDAVDVPPSRLARARAATAALLADAPGARLGLVVFGADAFSVAPLTFDPAVLVNLLAGAATGVVPRAGSRPDLALELARELVAASGAKGGEVILVGDSAGDARTLAAARALERAGFPLSVLAVGTTYGGPVRLGEGAFARTDSGEVLVARAEIEGLERVAAAGGGRFQLLAATGPIPRIARAPRAHGETPALAADAGLARRDDGALLVLLALPFAALLFRRGWLAGLAAIALALPAQESFAIDWGSLWLRPEQQAARAFAQGRSGEERQLADRLEPDSPWRALLLYRAGRYAEAEALFGRLDTADAHYNRGNALALAGRFEAALEAYAAALERSPGMRDAIQNRALVREALARQRAQPGAGAGAQGAEGAGERQRSRAGGAGAEGRAPRRPGAEPDSPMQAQDRAEPEAARESASGARERAERERLERLLSKVPDDPASLLANRFEYQLRQRGTPHRDTGARW
jgi:Ca-activated chloride channel family protein